MNLAPPKQFSIHFLTIQENCPESSLGRYLLYAKSFLNEWIFMSLRTIYFAIFCKLVRLREMHLRCKISHSDVEVIRKILFSLSLVCIGHAFSENHANPSLVSTFNLRPVSLKESTNGWFMLFRNDLRRSKLTKTISTVKCIINTHVRVFSKIPYGALGWKLKFWQK